MNANDVSARDYHGVVDSYSCSNLVGDPTF